MADTVPTAIVGARGSTATLTGKAVKTFTFTRFSFAHTFTRAFNLLFVVVVGLWCGGPCVSFGASTWLKGRAGVKERNNVNLSVDLQLIISFKKRKNESWRQGRAKRSTRGTTWGVMLDDLCGGCAVATVVLEGGGPNIFFFHFQQFFLDWIENGFHVRTVFLCDSLRC